MALLGSSLTRLWGLFVVFLLLTSTGARSLGDGGHALAKHDVRDLDDSALPKRQVDLNVYSYLLEALGSQHLTAVNQNQARGYMIISINVCGTGLIPLYTTVWSKRPGTIRPYVTQHNFSPEGFDLWFQNWVGQGYTPTLITVAGSADAPTIAAVMEKFSTPFNFLSRYGMFDGPDDVVGTYAYYNKLAFNQGMILKSFSIYGGPTARRWAAIWHANPKLVRWRQRAADSQPNAQYAITYRALTADTLLRPAYIAIDSDQTYASVFTDERLGPGLSFVHRYGLTLSELQAAINQYAPYPMYPVKIASGGSGANIRYAVILSPTEVPSEREWSTPSGGASPTGLTNPTAALSTIDNLVKGYMQRFAIRHAQISIKKSGQKRIDRAYTWSEPGRCGAAGCEITPAYKFLLASNSKMFVTAAIWKLLLAGTLTRGTLVYQYLGYLPAAAVDPRSMQITLQHLLDHKGGWDKEKEPKYDPTYDMRNIAIAQHNDGKPATKKDIADFMIKRPLDYAPGDIEAYSNYGFHLLTMMIEKATGTDYYTWLKSNILTPGGIDLSQIDVWQTAATPRPSPEILQEAFDVGLPALLPASNILAPAIYGGDGMIKENVIGSAGITCTMDMLSKFIFTHAVYNDGGRKPGLAREGSTPGAWTWAESRTDGIDWAIAFNTRDWLYHLDDKPKSAPVAFMEQISSALNTLGIT